MARQAQDGDDLKEAARRSSDVMGAFAAKRHAGMDAAESRRAARAESAWARSKAADSQAESRLDSRDEEGGESRAADCFGSEGTSSRSEAPRSTNRRGESRAADRSDSPRRGGRHNKTGAANENGRQARHRLSSGKHAQSNQRPPKSLADYISQNSVFILGVSAVVIATVIIIAIIRVAMPLSGTEVGDSATVSGQSATSDGSSAGGATSNGSKKSAGAQSQASYSYDWNNLVYEGDRISYVVDGKVKSRLGVDISDHQPGADWNAVASDGVEFAIVRLGYRGATEGVLHLDEQFEYNIDGAAAAGLDCGVYFFSQAITVDEAVEEADFVLKNLNGRKLAYPVVYDSEVGVSGIDVVRTANLSADELVAIAEAFCKRVEEAGYETMVYGNGYDLVRYTNDFLSKEPVWWAEYTTSPPSYDGSIAIWQYTSGGAVAGIQGGADLSIDLRGAGE